MCTVKVNGRAWWLGLHDRAAMPGLEVEIVDTPGPERASQDRVLLQMLFVEGQPLLPRRARKSGNCLLQATAYEVGMEGPHFEEFYPGPPGGCQPPRCMLLDLNRCILCELCVRASRDVDGKEVFAHRQAGGIESRISWSTARAASWATRRLARSMTIARPSICPVGAILPKRRGFATPIGERRSRREDRQPISAQTREARA